MTIIGTKDVAEAAEQSLQPRAHAQHVSGVTGILRYLAAGSYRIAPWWSPQRDIDLDMFWKDSDHLSGTLALLAAKVATVPVQVQPRDTRLKKNVEDAEKFNIILNEEADFGKGWIHAISKWLLDYWSSDSGAYFEIIGPGDPLGPIEGQPTGIAHLDSHRIQRTGDQEFPALYQTPDSNWVKFHHTRIAMTSDMPSPREEMNGIGFCACSRAIHNAQMLIDLATYKEEKLGSRPKRGIIIGKGIGTDHIIDAMAIADEAMDSRNLSIYSQMAVLGDIDVNADLSLLDLISLPDGFDEETSIRLGMFAIATSFGVPIRWIWPASVSGATKADAMYQHIAGLGGGIGRILATLTMLLGGDPRGSTHGIGKFLPPNLKLTFDFQDDEQDENRAKVQKTRADIMKIQLDDGAYDMRTAREYLLAAGDLTQAQFDRLEVEDGRLPDGSPILSLFHLDNQPFLGWLDLLVDNPLAVSENDPIRMLSEIETAAINVQDNIANSSNATTKAKAEQALSALNALKGLYAPLAQQSVQSDIMARFGAQPEAAAAETTPTEATPPPTEPNTPATETKDFDYGASAGEIISGNLARGAGGQFVSAQELKEQIRAGMIARMGGAGLGSPTNSASVKKAANRAKIAEALGVDVESLSGMITGETGPEQERAFAALGLATVGADGMTYLSPEGRKLLSAANSGDQDAAEEALSKAKAKEQGKGKDKAGSAAKPSPEQKAREREEAQNRLKEQNRAVVAEGLTGRLDQAQFNAMMQFADGAEPEPALQRQLAQAGLIEIDADGNSRMTSAGNRVVSAANKGDVRTAKDGLSAGAERVRNVLSRVEQQQGMADQYDSNAVSAQEDADARAKAYADGAEQLRGEINNAVAPYDQQAAGLDVQAVKRDGQAAALEGQARDYDNQAQALAQQAALAPTQQQRAALQTRADELTKRAQQAREQANSERDRAGDMRGQGLTLQERGREVRAKLDEQVRAYLDAADMATKYGADQAAQWAERAEKVRAQMREWQQSVGNASAPDRPLKALKAFFTKQESVIPTKADIEAAVRLWDADPDIPKEAKGILRAKRAK